MRASFRLPFAIVVVLLVWALVPTVPHALAASRVTVSGSVYGDDGAPLEGVSVSGYTASADTKGDDSTVTAKDGSFTLSLPAGKGTINVYYAKWGRSDSREVSVDADVKGILFTLPAPPPKTAIVEGRVLGPDGAPVEGATVRLDQGCCYYAMDGAGSTDAVPPSAPEATTAPEGSNASSASSGEKIAAMPIRCCCCPYDSTEPVTTGADGAFRFETYGGPRSLTVFAKGYAQTTQNVQAKDNDTVKVDLKLEKVPAADAKVTGRVVDAKTGAPIANAQVSLTNVEWSRSNWTTTGADGAFTFQTLPGWSQLTVYAGGDSMPIPVDLATSSDAKPVAPAKAYYQHAQTLTLKSGANDVTAKLEPKPAPSVALVGYVVDPIAKTGIPGAYVNVWNQDAGEWGSAQTDKTGSYKMLVRPGHYTINAYADGYLGGTETFVIPDGATTHRADVEAQKGTTKYAPCDDCVYGGGGGPIMYDYAKSAEGAPTATTPANAGVASSPTAAPQAASDASAPTAARASSLNAAGGTGQHAYAGEGGGLPPYDAASAAPGATTGSAPGQDAHVPGLGWVALVGVLGALAVLRRARP